MYPVNLRIHTVTSTHAYNILSDYIAQAKQEGIEFFATTDHGPDVEDALHHWYFIDIRIWPRVVDRTETPHGIEANIKDVDGEIDCSGKMSDSLDLVIADFHEPVSVPRDKTINTQAMIATITSGNVHIINHPGNPKYEIDVRAVAEAAAKHQVALEINNFSFLHSRKSSEDNCRAVAATVRDVGSWVALGSDSRTALAMGEFEECLRILDAVDFPPERILNVSPRRLLDFFEPRGMAPIAGFADL